jgi:hypothetical protein
MSQKQSKKINKQVRREARAIWGEGLEAMGKLMRKRPKYCPRFVWIILLAPAFKNKALKLIYPHI